MLWQQQCQILFPHRQQQLRALSASSPSTAASNGKGRGGAKNKGGAGGKIVNNAPDGAVKAKTSTNNSNSNGRSGGGGGGGGRGKKKVDPNAPLSNEHLIAELFNRRRGEGGRSSGGVGVTADTLEVRLIVDRGRNAGGESGDVGEGDGDGNSDSDSDSDSDDEDEGRGGNDDDDEDEGEESEDDDEDDEDVGEDEGRDAKAGRLFGCASEGGGGSSSPSSSAAAAAMSASSSSSPSPSSSSKSTNSQVTTLAHAITIAHEYSLDLVGVTLASDPPVIKAVDIERHLYGMKRRAAKATKAKRRGGGAISDRPLKEYKFRAGIAEHDLARKANGMMEYLGRGHAVRVTLTARQRSLKDDADAIRSTLERVRELLGDKAVEARGMKSNDRNSYGTLLLHPSKK